MRMVGGKRRLQFSVINIRSGFFRLVLPIRMAYGLQFPKVHINVPLFLILTLCFFIGMAEAEFSYGVLLKRFQRGGCLAPDSLFSLPSLNGCKQRVEKQRYVKLQSVEQPNQFHPALITRS